LIAQTVSGLERTSGGAVLASSVKRALLRKDPTFSEADYGFRAFGELMRHLAERNVVELSDGSAKGDPEVSLPSRGGETDAFELLRATVSELQDRGSLPALSGLKNQVRKSQPDFSEKKFGYRGFLQFCKAAETQGLIRLAWDDDAGDYLVEAVDA
jgi:OST-HTH/LOTUS domain